MTDLTAPQPVTAAVSASFHRSDQAQRRVRRRYAAERRFKLYGIAAVAIALGMLAVLLITIGGTSYRAFFKTNIHLELVLDAQRIDPRGTGDPAQFDRSAYQEMVHEAIYRLFPAATGRLERRDLREMVSPVASIVVHERVAADPSLVGRTISLWLPTSDRIDQLGKGLVDRSDAEERRLVNDRQLGWYDQLSAQGLISSRFNARLLTASDSNYPEVAGLWASIVGTIYTLTLCVVLAVPMAVAAAVYLEEFAPKNRWTDLIEVNINNLAAVPSIVFGLLGLAVFLQFFQLPRSAPLVGGLVLALMVLPTIIIATRAAMKAVPPSIREAALGLGASKLQTVLHHVVPLAIPGILTGTIIGMAHALGETAPLLLIGMNAFITDPPSSLTSPAAVLPVQIYIWAERPERGFVEMTSAAIVVLLVVLITMNGAAVWLRRRFERRW